MRWSLTVAAVVGGVVLSATPAAAQVLSLKPGAAPNAAPPTIRPAGTYSVADTEAGLPWRVVVDWGHLTEGRFESAGVIERVRLTVTGGDAAKWECREKFALPAVAPKPKADAILAVRARLQKLQTFTLYSTLVFGYWADAGEAAHQAIP